MSAFSKSPSISIGVSQLTDAATVNNQALQSPPASHDDLESPDMMEEDDTTVPLDEKPSVVTTVPEPQGPPGVLEVHDDEPPSKKRKRYNEPPTEIHAELRRPEREGQWYSKSREQWDELSHLHKLIYSHVGRIEETELGEEVEPCEACKKRGFTCMKYKQDHPEVEKLYKGNVRVGTSCTRCRRYRRTCAAPGSKPLTNGKVNTPQRPHSARDDMMERGSTIAEEPWKKAQSHQDPSETWDNELLAAVTGSPLTSPEASPRLPPDSPPHLPPHPPQARTHPADLGIDFGEMKSTVVKASLLTQMNSMESELRDLRAERSEYNKDRRDWKAKKRELVADISHLREDQRRSREEHWQMQNKVLQLEKDAMQVKNHDMQHSVAETELRAENRSLANKVNVLLAQKDTKKTKLKHLKRENKEMKRRIAELESELTIESSEPSGGMPPPLRKTRHSTVT